MEPAADKPTFGMQVQTLPLTAALPADHPCIGIFAPCKMPAIAMHSCIKFTTAVEAWPYHTTSNTLDAVFAPHILV